MKILSIDVGIKNLAFCLLEKPIGNKDDNKDNIHILNWDTINLAQQIEAKCCEIEKNKICNKPAKFTKQSKCYCLKHSKKQQFHIPTADLKQSFLNKQKLSYLTKLADDYKISYTPSIKKSELLVLINEHIHTSYFDPVDVPTSSKVDLVTIGRNIQIKFDLLLALEIDTIDQVIIENQISPIANRMKTIQGMIAQYFIMKNNNIQIDFVNASNKLKTPQTENSKLTYTERKKKGISHTLDWLTTCQYQKWEDFFKSHSKKDDLADSFLQGLWYINNKFIN
jgi:hypothetical protein